MRLGAFFHSSPFTLHSSTTAPHIESEPMSSNPPTLTTARLVLRPFAMSDAPDVQRLCNVRDIALNTLLIPHPYPNGLAESWISSQPEGFANGEVVTFAITLAGGGELLGATGMRIERASDRAEMGYWLGVPYWGQGYATEAARAFVEYSFDKLGLNRISAEHFTRNIPSGRVLQKIGMRHEGTMRQAHRKWGEYLDSELYAILRSDPRD
jgi:[ribosomal protein S5]-alanine N-acetyltransferase